MEQESTSETLVGNEYDIDVETLSIETEDDQKIAPDVDADECISVECEGFQHGAQMRKGLATAIGREYSV